MDNLDKENQMWKQEIEPRAQKICKPDWNTTTISAIQRFQSAVK